MCVDFALNDCGVGNIWETTFNLETVGEIKITILPNVEKSSMRLELVLLKWQYYELILLSLFLLGQYVPVYIYQRVFGYRFELTALYILN